MTTKWAKSAATDELDELFEGIGDEKKAPKKTTTAAKAGGKPGKGKSGNSGDTGKDILAELENELEDSKPVSRPHTPRIRETAAAAAKGSPARKAATSATAAAAAAAAAAAYESTTSLPRHSADSTKMSSARNSTEERPAAAAAGAGNAAFAASSGGGGGWWGGILSTASAAMKQAEAAVKEIQQNEEAKKWADQVRGNVSALKGYGDELRHRALPTFTNILQTLAPPISAHERLLIHITHDMVGYPSLDPLVHGVFSRVMAQVEGGDLLVIQRGQESAAAAAGSGALGRSGSFDAGWRDGPWWRVTNRPRDLGAVPGLHEGTKLCRASAEAYANEYYAAHYGSSGGGVSGDNKSKNGLEVARQRAVEPMSEDNPVRRSDLFLAVQAIATSPPADDNKTTALFAGSTADAKEKADAGTTDEADESDDLVSFAVYVFDPVHDIVYHTLSQAIPAKWVRWLDAPVPLTPASSGAEEEEEEEEEGTVAAAAAAAVGGGSERPLGATAPSSIPEDIREILESGGVDPREWVAEWVEEALTLAVGVVAQRYVARRMGVGEGSAVKGKRRMDSVLEDGGGEAARAGLI